MTRTYRVLMLVLLSVVLPGWLHAQRELPEGEGKDLVEQFCSKCHGLGSVTNSRHTTDEWRSVVLDMGVPLSDSEVEKVAAYLGKHFAPGTPENTSSAAEKEKVNINKATAQQLETELEWSAKEAADVVEYREKHGNFSNWEDLKKVAGLDAQKIEKVKDRLAF